MTRGLTVMMILILAGTTGCSSLRKNGGESRDPLYGRYIPKQDLPIPGRNDPLYTTPTSKPKNTEANSEPFRNSKGTTTAGLTSNVKVEESGLSLGDRRSAAEPATRGVPLRPTRDPVTLPGESWDRYAEELRKMKARYDAPVREANGDYAITATVPSGPDGALKRYEAVGPNAAAAAKQLIEQIKSDE